MDSFEVILFNCQSQSKLAIFSPNLLLFWAKLGLRCLKIVMKILVIKHIVFCQHVLHFVASAWIGF